MNNGTQFSEANDVSPLAEPTDSKVAEDKRDSYYGNSYGICRKCGMKIYHGVNHRKWCHPNRRLNNED